MSRLSVLFALTLLTGIARADYTGTLSEVKNFKEGSIALDLDGRYPNQKMGLYIPAKDAPAFRSLPRVGSTITATGPVVDYKGHPEIVLHDPCTIKSESVKVER